MFRVFLLCTDVGSTSKPEEENAICKTSKKEHAIRKKAKNGNAIRKKAKEENVMCKSKDLTIKYQFHKRSNK